jgi:hypothetical protein
LRRLSRNALLPVSVKFWVTSARKRNGRHLAAVALMGLLWVTMCALEISPELHLLLHKDAQSPGHNCLVTQFQHHQVLGGSTTALLPALPEASSVLVSCGDFQFYPSYDYRLTPSRGPPAG